MKTFNVTIKGEFKGTVTASTYTEATRKGAEKFNGGNWDSVGVSTSKITKKQIETAVKNNSSTELLKIFKGDRSAAADAVRSLPIVKLANRAYSLTWGASNDLRRPFYGKNIHSKQVNAIKFAKSQISDGSINTSYAKILIEGNRNIYWASPEYGHSDYNKGIAFENTEANRKLAKTINSILNKEMNKNKYFLFAKTIINGCWETVYLHKSDKFELTNYQQDLYLFESSNEANKYAQSKGWDMAECDLLKNI